VQGVRNLKNAEVAHRRHEVSLVGQDRLPGQGADQVGGEERQDDQEQQQVLKAAAAEGDSVGQRVADEEGEDGGDCGKAE
jgi:hypothetical protein